MRWLAAALPFVTVIVGSNTQCLSDNPNSSKETKGITDFGLDLFKALPSSTSEENFFFSPFSIWTALTLAYFGAAGNTEVEIGRALGVDDKDSAYSLYKHLVRTYRERQTTQTQYTFLQGNRAYFDNSLKLEPCVPQNLHDEIRKIDFVPESEAADIINGFVNQTTRGRIPTIVTSDDLIFAVIVLVNAAYFKGSWDSKFEPSNTAIQDFHISPHETTPVEMMTQSSPFNHGHSSDLMADVLELPYASDNNNTISMYVFLPKDNTTEGFDAMVQRLNGTTFRNAINPKNLRGKVVNVHLPKFKIETKLKKELKEGLMKLGIHDVFDPARANMMGFIQNVSITLDKTIHKANMEVTEEGAEAAAATVLVFVTRVVGPRTVFNCNRPFLFVIYDKSKGTESILFMGKYKNPSN